MTTKHLIRLTYDFIGLENYKAVLADPNFFKAFLNSVLWTLGSLAGQLIIGFTGALAINRVNFGKGIYRTLMIIPWAFPSIVIALSWKWILNGVSGFIPNILVQLGICNELPQFLSDNSFVFLTLIFINIWFGAPMIMVNVLSALQTIPQDQYEAAQIDGASKVQQFWYITVPHIKVVVGLLVVLRTIWVFNNFDIIYLLTGGGPANATTTMPIYMIKMASVFQNRRSLIFGFSISGEREEVTYLLREAYNKGAKTVLFTTNNGKKFSEYYSEVVALSSLRHLNYGNVISPQFPILIILDIIYAYYVEQNKYIREGMHDSTLCALEE